jgi:GntR family transcriptional regulator, trigonelline degradation regulator
MSPETSEQRIKRVSRFVAPVREQVLAMMRDAILSGTWEPGERLVERDICERTGASRSSVREAFRELETEGLVTTLPNKGVVVSTISAKEIADAIDLSEVVELYIVREFAECATEENTEALKRSLSKIEVAAREGRPNAANAALDEFHGILAKGADNVFVEQALTRLRGIVLLGILRLTMSPERLLKQARELQFVLEAIVIHDPGAAEEAMRTHLQTLRLIAAAAACQLDAPLDTRPLPAGCV